MPPRPLVAVSSTLVPDPAGPLRVRTNAAYVRALEAAGLAPVVVPPLADAALAADIVAGVAGVVLTGGEDVDPALYGRAPHPALGPLCRPRDATELALVAAARAARRPLLAICRGIQVLNVALGGTLVQDLPSERPSRIAHDPAMRRDARTHDVAIVAGSRLAAAVEATSLVANSLHHQAVDDVAPGLRVAATAPDGVIEGVETPDESWWVLGLQWHPEELTATAEAWDRGIFAAFAAAVRQSGSDVT